MKPTYISNLLTGDGAREEGSTPSMTAPRWEMEIFAPDGRLLSARRPGSMDLDGMCLTSTGPALLSEPIGEVVVYRNDIEWGRFRSKHGIPTAIEGDDLTIMAPTAWLVGFVEEDWDWTVTLNANHPDADKGTLTFVDGAIGWPD